MFAGQVLLLPAAEAVGRHPLTVFPSAGYPASCVLLSSAALPPQSGLGDPTSEDDSKFLSPTLSSTFPEATGIRLCPPTKSPASGRQSSAACMSYSASGCQSSAACLPSPVSGSQSSAACLPSPVSGSQSSAACLLSPVSGCQSSAACLPSPVSGSQSSAACLPSLVSGSQSSAACLQSSASGKALRNKRKQTTQRNVGASSCNLF